MNFHDVEIVKIDNNTADTVILHFNIPETIKKEFNFIPGQYITIAQTINNNEVRRSYSICSTPMDELLAVGVKKVSGGLLSTYIHNTFKVGDKVSISPPEGKFTVIVNEDAIKDYYFIAAGSGITPILSMIATIVEDEAKSRCYLLYGSRSEDQIIFKATLDNMMSKYAGQ